MATAYIELNTVPGNTIVGSSQIFGRTVLKVKRSGLGYDIVGSPAALAGNTRRVSHRLDKLTFVNPFITGEKVYVLIKNA